MKLWTIQTADIYHQIQRTGVYRCISEFSDKQEKEFRDAYIWIRGKMEEQIGPAPQGVSDPVWAWHTWEGNRKRPDFRNHMFLFHDKDCCLMEIEVPDEKVFLTDYDDWHFVMNRWFFHNEDPEDVWDRRDEWWENLPEEEHQRVLLESWDKLIGLPEETLMQKKDASIQATFWELRKEQVKKVWFYKARPYPF